MKLAAAFEPVASTLEVFAGLLYPPTCVQCDVPVAAGEYLCAKCSAEAERIEAPFCARCSEPFSGEIEGAFSCPNCRRRPFAFECAVSAYRGRGLVRELILRFKYQHEYYLRRQLGTWLASALDDERIRRRPADAIVPVPLHPRRQRERGFNQAAALCPLLGTVAGLPTWPALRRVRFTETQTHFSRAERLRNLRGAFAAVARWPVAGAHLLLVDDVFTTGSTVDECARVLRQAGAASVRVVTVARR
jgi:competence protein ComFC